VNLVIRVSTKNAECVKPIPAPQGRRRGWRACNKMSCNAAQQTNRQARQNRGDPGPFSALAQFVNPLAVPSYVAVRSQSHEKCAKSACLRKNVRKTHARGNGSGTKNRAIARTSAARSSRVSEGHQDSSRNGTSRRRVYAQERVREDDAAEIERILAMPSAPFLYLGRCDRCVLVVPLSLSEITRISARPGIAATLLDSMCLAAWCLRGAEQATVVCDES